MPIIPSDIFCVFGKQLTINIFRGWVLIYYRYDNNPVGHILRNGFLGTRHTDATFIPFGGDSVFASRSKVGAANFLKEIYNHSGYFTPEMRQGYAVSSIFNLYSIKHTGRKLDLYGFFKTYKRNEYTRGVLRYLTLEEYFKPSIRHQFGVVNEEVLSRHALRLLRATPKVEDVVDGYLRDCVAYTKEVILEGPIPPGKITWLGSVDIDNARFLTLNYL